MIHDIAKLHAVSIWMTMDLVTYTFLVEFREVKKIMRMGGYNSLGEFMSSLVRQTELLIDGNLWKAYIVRWTYDNRFIFQSNHDNLLQKPLNSKNTSSLDSSDLNSLLTKKERKVFCLIEEGLEQKDICKELNISLATLKTHRNNLYSKMGFSSKADLQLWFRKKNG